MTTKALESNTSTLDNVLPAIDYILSLFEQGKEKFRGDELLLTAINAGWEKLNKYYCMTEQSPAYAAAVVLNPTMKWQWFTKLWEDQPSWTRKAKIAVKKLWKDQYRPAEDMRPLDEQPSIRQANPALPPNEFTVWKHQQRFLR
jgi:hypothetical protein